MKKQQAEALKNLIDSVSIVTNFPEGVTWTRYTTEVWRDELSDEFGEEDAYIITITDAQGRQFTRSSVVSLVETLMSLQRRHVIEKWRELNHRLNAINADLTDLYGGPDIDESDDPDRVKDRNLIGRELKGLELAMTSDELDEVQRNPSIHQMPGVPPNL